MDSGRIAVAYLDGEATINVFLTHLAVHDNVSASTQNQALSARVFLYPTPATASS